MNKFKEPIIDVVETPTVENTEGTPDIEGKKIFNEDARVVVAKANEKIEREDPNSKRIDTEEFSEKAYEAKDTPKGISFLQDKLGLFKDAKNWKDVNKKLQETQLRAMKEHAKLSLLIGTVGLAGAYPLVKKYLLGTVVTYVANNSEVVKATKIPERVLQALAKEAVEKSK